MHISDDDQINLEKLQDIIRRNLAAHYSIEELASIALMSRSNLIKKYKFYFGISLYAQLQQLRLSLAKELLENTSQSIKLIAKKCGYRHACNFSNAFRELEGVTAKAWRDSRRSADNKF
ncbi:MAG: AraC family transcriptional regulator [Chitinophagaceae bacterium]|nr:MAG: AraC family transcriptional regulator [Chitinophagaceae bacterium]